MDAHLEKHLRDLSKGEILPEQTVKKLCDKLIELLRNAPNVEHVKAPVTIVGNLHGQFYDLLETFRVGGAPPDTNYLFLGDVVNRGFFSVETLSLLICLKLRFPDRITLLRGRHETRKLSKVYGFYNEVVRKYGSSQVWHYFTDLFDFFPIAAIIENSIFCVHSGIGEKGETVDHIRLLDRYQEVPSEGIVHEMLCANPHPSESGYIRKENGEIWFGADFFQAFMNTNRFTHFVRSNQLCIDGYQTLFSGKLTTIWGAPNFLSRCGNVATIFEVSENLDKIPNTFHAAPATERVDAPLDAVKAVLDYYR